MGHGAGEGGLSPRLFLVAPEGDATHLAACLAAACAVGDVASLLVPPTVGKALVALAQSKGVAVLTVGEARAGCDGVQVEATAEAVSSARQSIGKDGIVGAFAGGSRHFAMEAAEAGADYIAFSQNAPTAGGEPIIGWWAEFFQIPGVAFDPVDASGVDTLLPQNPDFMRPADAMWDSPEEAARIVTELMLRLGAT